MIRARIAASVLGVMTCELMASVFYHAPFQASGGRSISRGLIDMVQVAACWSRRQRPYYEFQLDQSASGLDRMKVMPRNPWEPAIDVDRDAALPPFLQIARSLAADIQRGRLRPGDRLPGSRRLAESLEVHRNTVLAALAELTAEGWIETAPGRGTFVSRAIVNPSGKPFSRRLALRTHIPANVPFALPEPPSAYRQASLPRRTLNLSNGAPDVRLVPARAIGRAYRRVLGLRGAELRAYGEPEGHAAPPSALASILTRTRGL